MWKSEYITNVMNRRLNCTLCNLPKEHEVTYIRKAGQRKIKLIIQENTQMNAIRFFLLKIQIY